MSDAATWWTSETQDVTLKVWRLTWWQNDDLVKDAFIFVECAVAFAGGIWSAIHAGSLTQSIAALLVAGLFGAFAYVPAVRIWRARTRLSIRVTGSEVVIHDPEFSAEPLEIRRGQILAVEVDDSVPERRRFLRGATRRRRQSESRVGVFRKRTAAMVQSIRIGPTGPPANLAILLRTPMKLDPVRRFDALPFPARHLRWDASCILATVEDPDAAREAFERWDIVREITERDLIGRGPSPEDLHRTRRARYAIGAYLFVGVGAVILLALLSSR